MMTARSFALLVTVASFGCASTTTDNIPDRARNIEKVRARAIATDESLPAIALQQLEAPGFDEASLTARFRAALPCPDTATRRFAASPHIAHASISRVGDAYLVSGEVLEMGRPVARHSAQGRGDLDALVDEVGESLGAQMSAVPLPGG
jgi:hypothetical protein